MPRENAATKAARYLVEGRCVIEVVGPGHVSAVVRGEGAIYRTLYSRGVWWCSCEARRDCAHIRALKLVVAVDVPEPR